MPASFPGSLFDLFREFSQEIFQYLLLNTIRRHEGLSITDMHALSKVPLAKLHRITKMLEEKGYLLAKDEDKEGVGRPKKLYYLSGVGRAKIRDFQEDFVEFIELVGKLTPSSSNMVPDARKMIENALLQETPPVSPCTLPPGVRFMLEDEELSPKEKLQKIDALIEHFNVLLELLVKKREELGRKYDKEESS